MNPNNKKTAKIIEKPVDIAFTFTKRKIQIAYFEFVTIKDTLTILFLTQMNTQMVHNLPLTKFGHKFEDFDHFRSL